MLQTHSMNRKVVRIFGTGLAVIGAVAALLGVAYGTFIHRFNPSPPAMMFPRPADRVQAQHQDLTYFRALLAMDKSFSPAARAAAQQAILALESSAAPLSRQKLHVALMKIMALADNGHSQVGIVPSGAEVDVLPVRVTAFADGLYIMRAKSAYREILGSRVEAIDNVPIDSVLLQLESLRGGLEGFRLGKAALYVSVQDLLNGLGISPDTGKSGWTVRMPSGEVVTRTLAAYELGDHEPLADSVRWMSPELLNAMGADWLALRPAAGDGSLSQSLQNFDVFFLREAVENSCATYVRMRAIADEDGQRIQPFIRSTEDALRTHPPCAVILDLRYSAGGDFTNTYSFMHHLPKLVAPGGHVYVLTDAMTFSAAITTAGFVKEAGGDAVTIVGEPIGDRLAFFAEGNRGCLPNSKLCVDYATGKHDYTQPCSDWNVCFWLTWLYPVRVKTLSPDEIIPVRFADWNRGHDVAFERAVQLSNQLALR
jgi:hypothetical protein